MTYPTIEQALDQSVPILGSASLPYFERYAIHYGEGVAPSAWTLIGPPRMQPVREGVLETWDTASLPDGTYTLLLNVVDNQGQQQFARQLVRIQHSAGPQPDNRRR